MQTLKRGPCSSAHKLWPKVEAGKLASAFDREAPSTASPYKDILHKLETKVFPGVMSWQHPLFMTYYPSSSSVPAVLSELVVARLGSVGLQWASNPIATELEVVIMDWVAKFLGLGQAFHHSSGLGGGLIQNTAGDAMLNVMLSARVHAHRQMQPALAWEDAFHQDSSSFVVYMSDQVHFSALKATRLAGMRARQLPADRENGNFALQPSVLRRAMDEDLAQGLKPIALILTYGSTNTCGVDDPAAFRKFADELWIHVDAAYAGAAWALDEFKPVAQVVSEVATSVNVNGSKWFLCGFDSAFLWTRDRNLQLGAFSASASYLADVSESQESIYNPEFKDWSVPLGRRFRALRVWMVFEYFGSSGLRSYLQKTIDQANWLRDCIQKHPAYEQPVLTQFGLVCMRCVTDAATKELCNYLQQHGFGVMLSQLGGRPMLRVALGGSSTEQEHVEELWQHMLDFACHQGVP